MAPSKYGDDVRGRIVGADRTPLADAAAAAAKTELHNGGGVEETPGSDAKTGAADAPPTQNCASPSSDKENNAGKEDGVVVNGNREKTASPSSDGNVAASPTDSPK